MRNKMIFAAALALTPLAAAAHVTLAESSATPGSHYLAHFRVGHGCSGSPTTQLSVAIPDGVSAVEPQPAPGWTVELAHGGARVSAVTWKGGTLAADAKGEFSVAMTLPFASVARSELVVAERFRRCEKTSVPEKVLLSVSKVEDAEVAPTHVPLIERQPLVMLRPL